MQRYEFKDNNANTNYVIFAESEDNAWADLCDCFGTGYVFENIELLG